MSSGLWGVRVARRLVVSLVGFAALGTLVNRALGDEIRPRQPRRIVVRLSTDVLASLIDKPVERRVPVDEEILGTHVTGEAHVEGRPVLQASEDPASASFDVTLSGTVNSQTVGRNGPAIIRGRCETQFTAASRVTFQPGQGFVAAPAEVKATTRSTTDKVSSTRRGVIGRVVVRKAWEQINESRDETEAIVRERTENRIREEFDELLQARLERVNRTADVGLAVRALLGDSEPHYSCSTSGGCLQIAASTSDSEDAAVSLPSLGRATGTAQIWVHNSVVGDSVAHSLRKLDLVRRSVESVVRTLDVVPRMIALPSEPTNRPLWPMNPIDYATADEWIVLQLGGQSAGAAATTARVDRP
jgi:hypothetical protein